MTWFVIGPLIGFGLAACLTPLVRTIARRWRIVDDPASAPDRKLHPHPTPLLGGLAIILAAVAGWWILAQLYPSLHLLPGKYLLGLSAAGFWIFLGGYLDDRFHLRPLAQLIWPVLAVLSTIAAGVGVDFVTNPFGGLIYLNQVNWHVLTWHGTDYFFTVWADIFGFLWLMGMMYTTKILDGLDGLVSGIGVIGSMVVFLLTLRPEVNQPGLGAVALTFGGACLGFLLFNWHPAKIFLGESGAVFIGYMLGVMSIISGGKIATALLIMGLPILDLVWVILQRRVGAHVSPFRTSDRRHLHFRLVDAGLSIRASVMLLYGLTLLFGLGTLWFHGTQKILALAGILIVLVVLVWWVSRRLQQRAHD